MNQKFLGDLEITRVCPFAGKICLLTLNTQNWHGLNWISKNPYHHRSQILPPMLGIDLNVHVEVMFWKDQRIALIFPTYVANVPEFKQPMNHLPLQEISPHVALRTYNRDKCCIDKMSNYAAHCCTASPMKRFLRHKLQWEVCFKGKGLYNARMERYIQAVVVCEHTWDPPRKLNCCTKHHWRY